MRADSGESLIPGTSQPVYPEDAQARKDIQVNRISLKESILNRFGDWTAQDILAGYMLLSPELRETVREAVDSCSLDRNLLISVLVENRSMKLAEIEHKYHRDFRFDESLLEPVKSELYTVADALPAP